MKWLSSYLKIRTHSLAIVNLGFIIVSGRDNNMLSVQTTVTVALSIFGVYFGVYIFHLITVWLFSRTRTNTQKLYCYILLP